MSSAKSEATREKLIRSTARLLRTQGYGATGLSEITAESGVPKGSLYHHFPGGKEALAAASMDHAGAGILVRLQGLLERVSQDPVEAIRSFCDFYVEQLESSDFRRGCPIATVALETATEVDAVQEACARAFANIAKLVALQLEDAGLARDEARGRAHLVLASIEGALLLAKTARSTEALLAVRDQVTQQLTDDIARASEAHERNSK